jgi:ATP adenylyltransferase
MISTVEQPPNQIFRLPQFTFNHAACFLEQDKLLDDSLAPQYLVQVYINLFDATGVDYKNQELREEGDLSYNFLWTKHWAFIVIRRSEKCGNITVNSLGFAGTLLAKNEAQMKEIRETRPLSILKKVAAD